MCTLSASSRSVHVDTTIISIFYKSVVESVLTFCMLGWYGNSSLKARSKFKRIVSSARRIGCDTSSLQELYECLIEKKAARIVDISHPLNRYFVTLPPNRRYKTIGCRTKPCRKSFAPAAVRHVNN